MAGSIQTIHAYHLFGDAIRADFEREFPDRQYVVWKSPEELERGIADVEVLFAFNPPRDYWPLAHKLRMIQTTGAGVDSILPAPGLNDNVLIANARGIHGTQMAEFAIAMMLAFAKQIPKALDQQREHRWKLFGQRGLEGKTLGILGLGAIGSAIARYAAPFGMKIIGTQRKPKPVPHVNEVLSPEETERVLQESDFLVVLLPLTPQTRGRLDAKALSLMKPDAVLINMARGGIVDEDALAEALRTEKLGGAALDVFEQEPLQQESPLWSAPNTILTPHLAGMFADYMVRVAEILFENIRRLEHGEPLLNPVDRTAGY